MKNFNPSTPQALNTSTSDGVAIRVDHISKKYCKSLKRSMFYGIKDIGRNILGLSSHSERLRNSEFWAVDDVSFEVKKGETLGIIGPNGSGKTTLLKMLNGIFWPDKGKITIKGRVSALIEVGAGFHPLLTGRENVYINAAILGMTKGEVDEKFDAIVNFADIGDFIDSPVKHYSSGMHVRLGFAIAVHSEPDILLVDEVLAVGDMAFQGKCLEKIKELKSAEKTIVFISHDMHNIRTVCNKAFILKNGQMGTIKNSLEATSDYRDMVIAEREVSGEITSERFGNFMVEISKFHIMDSNYVERHTFEPGDSLIIRIDYVSHISNVTNPVFGIGITRKDGLTSWGTLRLNLISVELSFSDKCRKRISHITRPASPITNHQSPKGIKAFHRR